VVETRPLTITPLKRKSPSRLSISQTVMFDEVQSTVEKSSIHIENLTR